MTVPSYTTDLADYDLSEDDSTWFEFTSMSGAGSPDEDDTDNEIQGTMMCSQATNIDTQFASMGTSYGGTMSLSTGDVVLVWQQHTSPGAIATYANDGMQIVIGVNAANWEAWTVGGSDVFPNPYGGWQNNPVDPTITPDTTYGSPGAYSAVGSAMYMVSSVFKGQPHQCDAIRYGRAEARLSGGEAANYATFIGFATKNDLNTVGNYNRWGLLQATMGGFLWKGLFTIGYEAACDFRDSNKTIYVQDTRKVLSDFNRITIGYASTNVDWDGISIICASPTTTASKGELQVITDVMVAMTGCQFIDMSTFGFLSNSTLTGTTFRRCDLVTQGGAVFTGCAFEKSPAAVALLVDDIADITDCMFMSDGTGHAVEYRPTGAGPFTVNWDGHQSSGYAATDGDTGNETILIHPVTNGATIDLTVANGAAVPTIMEHADYTGTFELIIPEITLTLTGLVDGSDIEILTAGTETERVNIQENSGTAYGYAYSYAAEDYIDVGVFKPGYTPFYVRNYLLGATNGSLPIAQEVDIYYLE